MSEPSPPPSDPLRVKARMPYEPMAMPFTGARGKTLLFVAIVAACAGTGAYMFFVEHMAWSDMRVIGPGVGALWFGLRLFMTLTPRT